MLLAPWIWISHLRTSTKRLSNFKLGRDFKGKLTLSGKDFQSIIDNPGREFQMKFTLQVRIFKGNLTLQVRMSKGNLTLQLRNFRGYSTCQVRISKGNSTLQVRNFRGNSRIWLDPFTNSIQKVRLINTNYMKPWVARSKLAQQSRAEQYSTHFHTLVHNMESFNPSGVTTYTVERGMNGNKELEIAADFAMTLGEIHVHYFYHCSQTTSQLLWKEKGAYHRSEFREDRQPSAKKGPLVPFGSKLQVVFVYEGDCWHLLKLSPRGSQAASGLARPKKEREARARAAHFLHQQSLVFERVPLSAS